MLLRLQKTKSIPPVQEKTGKIRTCPLCGEILNRGENVSSVLYPAQKGVPDRMMEIYGCPHCYPEGHPRTCPVCKKIMQPGHFLIARCFEKPGKTHVHVLGCTGCYSKQKQ